MCASHVAGIGSVVCVMRVLSVVQAMERVEQLESQLNQEHSLRSAADSYLLELQQARQRAASRLTGLRDGQSDIAAHCSAVK